MCWRGGRWTILFGLWHPLKWQWCACLQLFDICLFSLSRTTCWFRYLINVSVGTRSTELSHITEWAKRNNLKLNLAKTHKIIFVGRKRKQKVPKPVEISQLQRVTVITILGITITNGLLVTSCLVGNCIMCTTAQVLYTLRVLRAHGLCDSALHTI